MDSKDILFLTGTRADFGKIKSLIKVGETIETVTVHVFVTGMHMKKLYGNTIDEVVKSGFKNIFQFINHDDVDHMDRALAKTIDGLSHYIAENPVDLIIVHGDRIEALAGAIVGSLNNIHVAHIEGGEISGTIDELIRHAVSKMSHTHLVANEKAKQRLLQLGELEETIHVIGSPDLDLMKSSSLPGLESVKSHYQIDFDSFAIAMYHPVTTEIKCARRNAKKFVDALIMSKQNYILIYPNNDIGSKDILEEYKRLSGKKEFKIFPSIRFEYFLVLLKNSDFIVGNSSAGVREAPYYDVPTVNVGTRQLNRVSYTSIKNCSYESKDIISTIENVLNTSQDSNLLFDMFGKGDSDKQFKELLLSNKFWNTEKQKQFQEI